MHEAYMTTTFPPKQVRLRNMKRHLEYLERERGRILSRQRMWPPPKLSVRQLTEEIDVLQKAIALTVNEKDE